MRMRAITGAKIRNFIETERDSRRNLGIFFGTKTYKTFKTFFVLLGRASAQPPCPGWMTAGAVGDTGSWLSWDALTRRNLSKIKIKKIRENLCCRIAMIFERFWKEIFIRFLPAGHRNADLADCWNQNVQILRRRMQSQVYLNYAEASNIH